MFLRRSTLGREPLPVAMSGVRMGERVLQIGLDDPRVAGSLAAKVGLSGQAAFVVTDERTAEKARAAAAHAGVLADVHVSALDSLPFPDRAFDLVVVNGMGGLLGSLESIVRASAFRECYRILRTGGRLVAVEVGTTSGFAAVRRALTARAGSAHASEFEKGGGAVAALQAAGFVPVRLLGDREGYRFTEGLRS